MNKLSKIVREFAVIEGALAAGIATIETLAGGPPSTNLSYVLPEAKSAIGFAVGMDQSLILPYLAKKERLPMEREMIRANVAASGIALHLANYLTQKGHHSVAVAANNVFRPSESGYPADMYQPDISHRFLAVRCGVGHMGLSGNVITQSHGAAVILGAVVTTAELSPTPFLPTEENYCDSCRLCMASCVAKFMDRKNKTTVTLGGVETSYAKRGDYGRCDLVCSGFTGLHSSGKWSTWSPGRFPVPKNDALLRETYQKMSKAHSQWPPAPGGRYFFYTDDKMRVSCANCQLVCCPDKEERKARHRTLTESGVVLQKPTGELEAVSSNNARQVLDTMHPSRKSLYEDV